MPPGGSLGSVVTSCWRDLISQPLRFAACPIPEPSWGLRIYKIDARSSSCCKLGALPLFYHFPRYLLMGEISVIHPQGCWVCGGQVSVGHEHTACQVLCP